jgi:hypothetical protein
VLRCAALSDTPDILNSSPFLVLGLLQTRLVGEEERCNPLGGSGSQREVRMTLR